MEKLGFNKIFNDELSLERRSNKSYSSNTLITMVIAGILSGAKNLSQVLKVSNDRLLRKRFNWKIIPNLSTLTRYFSRFSMKSRQELLNKIDQLREKVWQKIDLSSVTLDMDSTVSTDLQICLKFS